MLIVGRGSGRLGNRLFTFAHFIGNAIEYNYKVLNPAFAKYAEYFVGTQRQITPSYPKGSLFSSAMLRKLLRVIMHIFMHSLLYLMVKKSISLPSSKHYEVISINYPDIYDWCNSGYLDSVHKKNIITNSWIFWDHKNFHKHATAIRDYFRPLHCYENNVKRIAADSRRDTDILIGVHIRHGDYARYMGGKYFYTAEQYRQIMDKVKIFFDEQRVKFLIISNAKELRQNFRGQDCCFGSGDFIEDMYVLAECDYIMGPPSSFSAWAAFYGDKPLYYIENIDKDICLTDFAPFDSAVHFAK